MYLDEVHRGFANDVEERPLLEVAVEDGLLGRLKVIEPLVVEITSSDEQLFSVIKSADGKLGFQASLIGKRLLKVLSNGQGEFAYYFPVHELNPYVDLLFSCARGIESTLLFSTPTRSRPEQLESAVEALNGLVDDMRQMASGHQFKRLIRGFAKAANKRAKSLDAYIDALFEKRSRLVVIRLDLSYGSGLFHREVGLQGPLLQVKDDWARMQRDLYKGVPIKGLLGFACKLEYGHSKGFHFHLLAFYDGAMYCQDVVLAKLLGEHWQNVITKGKGRYFNCNNQQWKYRHRGIGVVGHLDADLIQNLKGGVAGYLAKTDYWVRFSPRCGRTFFRGNMPKLTGVKRGRPRIGGSGGACDVLKVNS
ncbi:inovirus Gp2 family protein [Pseudomonas sp. MMS21-TM103]|uniref:inovirus-type Gp2 protein n=1 Tax=Pseudomonas sp. MMS21 TM103 TaxID=2886506 RepID=UPI001EDCD614|nr:inovirus-type Gp2 protein [Pseudomonas sp. MMS21 TM103]MCG4453293.1 inovirus Gp2 family protein [Pseudomonas sp. MMS21 TM103]